MSVGARAIAEALPNYEIGQELGRGGFGVVYLGRQRSLGRPVAIKQLPPTLAGDAAVRERFVTEARLLASLDHPHIVPVYDYVDQDDLCLLVMECLSGGTVWHTFRTEGLTPQRACAVVIATACGLHYAHAHGVLHRDVKPENLLLTSALQLKVSDFGIAQVIGGADAVATSDGGILGTPAYMAPEQARGSALSPAADVYACGVMLYELLSGKLPFSQDGGGLAIMYRHVYGEPTPLEENSPGVPQILSDVVMRAIARDPADRFATAEDFAVALSEAAAAVFKDDWYAGAGFRVMGSDRVMTTLSGRSSSSLSQKPPPQSPPAGTNLPVPAAPNPPAPAVVLPPMHPSAAEHVVGVIPLTVKPQPLVAVRQLFDAPAPPRRLLFATGVLAALTLLAAFFGIGASADHGGSLPASSTVSVAGTSTATRVSVDLGKPIAVRIDPAPADATSVRLVVSARGWPVGKSDHTTLARRGGAATGTLSLSSVAHLVAGPVTGTIELYAADGRKVADRRFELAPSGSGFVTIPGIVIALLVLFVLAYLESLARPLWRLGRWRLQNGIGLAGIGALLGIVLTAVAWALGRYQPNLPTAAACAVLGAVTAVVGALTIARLGMRSRVRRLNKRYPFDQLIRAHDHAVAGPH